MNVPELSGALPLLGHILEFRRDPVALLERLRAQCGDAGTFRLGPRRVLVLSAAEGARQVLLEHADAFEKGPTVRRFARSVLGKGLIASDNAANREQRRDVSHAFQPANYAFYTQQFEAAAQRAAARWSDGQEVDLEAEMLKISLDALGHSLFSADLLDSAAELSQSVAAILHGLTARIRNPLGLGGGQMGVMSRAVASLDRLIYGLIEARRRDTERPRDLLTSLVEGGLGDREIRDALTNLFIAGHETSGTSLAWTWSLLARHPDTLARARTEASRAVAAGPLSGASSEKLSYVSQVFREALRLYPPVHSLGRQATRPVTIAGHELARGAIVVVSVYLLHRRADYFPEPLAFRPERFASEDAFPKHAYLPFGAGARACIGRQFGLTQAQLVLGTLLPRVWFEPVDANGRPRFDAPEPEMLITLRPRDGIRARVRFVTAGPG